MLSRIQFMWKSYIDLLTGRELPRPLVSRRKANGITLLTLFVGVGILFASGFWWPGTILVLGGTLAARQLLRNRMTDLVLTLFVFISLFLSVWIQINWELFMPVILSLAALTLAIRELLIMRPMSRREQIEDDQLELNDE